MMLEDRLENLYAHRFPPGRERDDRARLWRTLCDAFFSRYVPEGGSVLDIGAGYCDFINHVRAARRVAVDLNPETLARAAEGVEAHAVAIEQLGEVVAPESIDLAFASNVFEHLRSPEALLEALAAIWCALKPGGRLIVMQPNVRLVGGRFWDFFDHTLPLTENGMAEALAVAGFEVVERRARFLPYTTKDPYPRPDWLVRLYLRLPPAQWVFGKQMLLLARRPTRP